MHNALVRTASYRPLTESNSAAAFVADTFRQLMIDKRLIRMSPIRTVEGP
jgi:hypothetical protein